MIRTVIVDDEPLALEVLRARLADIPGVEVVGTAEDGDEGLQVIARLKPDLLFLDIQMPKRSGMSMARALRDMGDVPIVFVTANPVFAAEAFEVAAIDYVLKPVQPERLLTAVQRARRRIYEQQALGAGESPASAPKLKAEPEPEPAPPPTASTEARPLVIWVPKRDRMIPLRIVDIDWIEAARDYVLLHTAPQAHLLRTTMDNLVDKMDPEAMVRISRSIIVNLASVESIQEHGRSNVVVAMKGGAALKVGTTYIPAVRSVMAAFRATAR